MKKTILTIALILIALVAGFIIGRETASIKSTLPTSNSAQQTETGEIETSTTSPSQSTTTPSADNAVFDSSEITPEQRKLLGTFGIDADAVVVTAAMISCAETKIGKPRLEEIFAGSTPTFFEGIDLFSCYEK